MKPNRPARVGAVALTSTGEGLRLDAAETRDLSAPAGLLPALLDEALPLTAASVGGVDLDLDTPAGLLLWRLVLTREAARRGHRKAGAGRGARGSS